VSHTLRHKRKPLLHGYEANGVLLISTISTPEKFVPYQIVLKYANKDDLFNNYNPKAVNGIRMAYAGNEEEDKFTVVLVPFEP